MHRLAARLFPICRSITGDGVRETLGILGEYLPGLALVEVPTGTIAFDWAVPDEWNIREAYLLGPDGKRVVDFADSNLHLVSYSTPIDISLSLSDLQDHLHSDADLPDAIPYVTSYYDRTWGFCLTHSQRQRLDDGTYRAVIRGTLEPGSLTYGELLIPGGTKQEVFITTYICHPSLANNELSGPVVATALAKWVSELPQRKYTYRFVFAPEGIGALTYASRNLEHLRENVVAGFNLTCIGDDGDYSYLASRLGDLEIDRIGKHVTSARDSAKLYSYLYRGSDERTYCAPGIDLPLISLMRTRYGHYRGYHTSLDDLSLVTATGLQGGLDLVRECIQALEVNEYYETQVLGEAQLGRRGLYHTFHAKSVDEDILLRTHVMAYADGYHSVVDMAILFGLPVMAVSAVIEELVEHGLLVKLPQVKER